MQNRPIGVAPNYTNPALVMLGVNLGWIFFAIWAAVGMMPVLLLAAAINLMINRLRDRRGA